MPKSGTKKSTKMTLETSPELVEQIEPTEEVAPIKKTKKSKSKAPKTQSKPTLVYAPLDTNTALSYVTTDWKPIIVKCLKPHKDEINKTLTAEFDKYYFIDEDTGKLEFVLPTYPPVNYIFNAFNQFDFADLKLVIIGQDPYINEVNDVPQAMGMSFSVPDGVPPPPSLKNIYAEMESDLNITRPSNGDLTYLAKQGVLWLNASLTVRKGKSNSHAKLWASFTDDIIKYISANAVNPVVFILWGGFAQGKSKYIDSNRHGIIKGAHPSPLSVTKFMGGKYFSKANTMLINLKQNPIEWDKSKLK